MDFGELFAAVDLLQKEKGIPKAYMLDKISQALVTAYKQGSESDAENIEVVIDEVGRSVRMYVSRQVVENVENPDTEITTNSPPRSMSS
jgi:N utilization substance protein A